MEKNPHYCPPILKWNHVEIEVPSAWQMTYQETGSYLHIKLYPPDAIIPPEAMGESLLLLPPGHRVFVIRDDTKGPPVDHAYTPDHQGLCIVCGGNGSGYVEGMRVDNYADTHLDTGAL